jgi:hypothetical protein
MDLGSALLFLALLLLVALFVARPLLQGQDEGAEMDERGAALDAEHNRVLDALAELDADWELGKVPEEIYKPQREQLVAEGAAVLKKLDEQGDKVAPAKSAGKEISDDKLEALIASRKARAKKARK